MRAVRFLGGLLSVGCLLAVGCNKYEDKALETVRTNRGDLQGCVNEAFQRNANAKGAVELAFEVAPDGKVNRFVITKNETGDEQLSECIKGKAVPWQFTPPPSGKMEQFKYQFHVKK